MRLIDKLRMLIVPMALAPLAFSSVPVLLSTTAQATQLQSMTLLSNGHRPGASFAGGGGPVADTCNRTDEAGNCELDDFIARCDAAGGGLSTKPGGGVDCDTSGWEE